MFSMAMRAIRQRWVFARWEERRKELPCATDGVVVKLNDLRLGVPVLDEAELRALLAG
jgi:NAD-dependent DNA ligase